MNSSTGKNIADSLGLLTVKQLVFIDSQVENYQFLASEIIPGIEVVILQKDRDGITQISEVLQSQPQAINVHLVSHGSPGCLYLGNSQLSLDTLDNYTQDLKTWFSNSSLIPHPSSLLIYGCNVAAGDAGAEFIAKLKQITGAEIAATATRTGNAALGGDWNLEVTTAEIDADLAFAPETIASYAYVLPGGTPIGIASLNANYQDLPDSTSGNYTAPGKFDNVNYQHRYQVGTENNLVLSGFSAGSLNYNLAQVIEQVQLRRVNNANVSGTRDIVWFQQNGAITNNIINLNPSAVTTMETAIRSNVINQGGDNIFANSSTDANANLNNIERIDFISPKGLSAPSANLDDVGFLILERGGNDQFKVAPITAIDASGNPTAFGTPVSITNTGTWGRSTNSISTAVMVRDVPADANLRYSTTVGNQAISGIFFTYRDLGITANQTFYGYAIVGGDVTATTGSGILNVNNASNYPINTSDASGAGGLDLISSGGIFVRDGANLPPTIDLNGSTAGNNYSATFTENGLPLNIANSTSADAADFENNITRLNIVAGGSANDAATEVVSIGGRTFTLNANRTFTGVNVGGTSLNLAYTVSNRTFSITNNAGATTVIPEGTLDTLMRGITYQNTSENPTGGDRTFSFTATDAGGLTSATAVSTINVIPVNDPPIIDLNSAATTADTNRNFAATFTENGLPLNIANSTLADAADSENNITRLNIVAGGSANDAATEVVSIGGQSFTLNANRTFTGVNVGGTSLNLAYTVSNRTFSITNNAGATTVIPEGTLDTLMRGITYQNTSENPTGGDRTFSFTATDAGGLTSATAVSTINVIPVNDPPVIDLDANNNTAPGNNYQTSFTENGAAVAIGDVDTTITDLDNSNITSATITLTNALPSDLLAAGTLPPGITATAYNPSTGVITLNGSASLANYQTAIRAISFNNTSDNPSTTPRTVNVVVSDGTSNSNTATTTINVIAVNDPPVIDLDANNNTAPGNNYQTSFTENGAAVAIGDVDTTITDLDNSNITSATITLTNALPSDLLAAGTLPPGITATAYNPSTGVITLNGSASLANYQTAIRAISFNNTSDNPSTTPRTVNVVVSDGTSNSNTATTTINVIAVNDPPVIDLDANNNTAPGNNYQTSFTENGAAVAIGDVDTTITDPDSTNITSATITLTNALPSDLLAAGTLPPGITATAYNPSTGVITLNGSASLANYQTAIRAISFNNTSDNPSTTPRTVNVVVSDGTSNSNTATTTINVIPVNDPPVIDLDANNNTAPGNNYQTSFTENGAAVAIGDVDTTITDLDNSNITSATITLTNALPSDLLAAGTLPPGITATAYNPSTGVITLNGSASLANYQTAIRAISFNNTSDNPSTTPRTVNVVVSDGTSNSNTATTTINVIAVNDPPVIDLDANNNTAPGNNYQTSFTENGAAVAIGDVDTTITDLDSTNITSATITLTNALPSDLLAAGTLPPGITATAYNPSTGVITLNGSASLANYQTAIRAISFNNTSDNPSTTPRTVNVVVSDGTSNSNTATTTINVIAVNDPPVIDLDANNNTAPGNNYQTSFTENGAAVSIGDVDTTITDPDSTNITSATITLTNALPSDLLAAGTLPPGITATAYNPSTGVITLNGSASLANYQTAIRAISFNNTSDNPSTTPRTVNVVVSDGTSNSNTATTTINVIAVNDPPVLDLDANNSTATGANYLTSFTEKGAAVSIGDVDTTITDPDSTNITSATITLTNALPSDLLAAGTLPPGITATAYNPSTGVITLNGSASLANYQTAIRAISFNNTSDNPSTTPRTVNVVVSDGTSNSNTATTTINVIAVNDPPVIDLDANNSTATGANYLTSFTEKGAAVSIGDVDTTITDPDSTNITSATITLTNALPSDLLAAGTLPAGITASPYNPSTGVITLTGSATLANYQTAIRAISFNNTSDNPSTTPRTVNVVVSDGTSNSNTATTTITINGLPNAVPDTNTATEAGNVVSDNVLNGDDLGDEPTTVTSANQGENEITIGDAFVTAAGGSLTLNINGSYSYTPPTQGSVPNGGLTEVFNYTITDEDGDTDSTTLTINVADNNTPPTVDLNGNDTGEDYSTVFSQGSPGVAIADPNTIVTDDSGNITNATITLTNFQTGDVLDTSALPTGTGIGVDTSSTATNILLTGTGTVAEYQAAIAAITFNNTDTTPDRSDRTINVVVNDGTSPSNTATTTIQWDTDGDSVADTDDIDDDNDGIVDLVEAPIFSVVNGNFGTGTLTTVTPNQEYTQQIGSVTLTYTNAGSASILPFDESTNSADELFASGTTIEYVYPNEGAVQSMEFSSPVFAQFAITDVDQNGELHRIKVYDENGDIIPNPASFISTTAEGSTGTFPNGTPTTFNDLGSNVTTTPGADFVELSPTSPGSTDTFVRANMLYFDFSSSLISKIEVANNGTAGQPGFLFNIIDTSELDSDNDGVADSLDIDADDDGIPDNIEAQTTADYIAPSGQGSTVDFIDTNGDGLDDNYDSNTAAGNSFGATGTGLTPVDTDSTLGTADSTPDYLDADSDNDSILDIAENGFAANSVNPTDADTDGDGLKDVFETANTSTVNDGFDVNDAIDAPLNGVLPDTDNDAATGTPLIADLDYRDAQLDNLLPNAVADTNTATEAGAAVTDNVLTGDDLGDEPTTVTSADQNGTAITLGTPFTTEGGGSITLNSDGTYSYTPPAQGEVPNGGLVEVFNYTITDENGDSSSTTLTIDVADNNLLPTANPDTNTATEAGAAVTDNVLTGDDLGDEPTTVTAATQGSNVITIGEAFTTEGGGTLTLNSDGTYSYTPPAQGEVPNGGLVEVFNYTITDENGDSSSTTLTIDVADNNLLPTANPDTNTATEAGAAVTDNVLTGDDLGDEPTTVTAATQGSNVITIGEAFTTEGGGTLTLNSDGTYSYTPPAQGEVPNGGLVEVFNYTITDENGDSSSTTLTIDVADNNLLPTANPDTNTATEAGAAVTDNVLTGDDLGDEPTTVTAANQGENVITLGTAFTTEGGGSITLNSDGSYSYTPPAQGEVPPEGLVEVFNYTITDENGDSSSTTLTIDVADNNLLPNAVADTNTATEAGVEVSDNVLNGDDLGDEPTTVTSANQGENVITLGTAFTTEGGGSLTLNSDGSYSYTPPAQGEVPPEGLVEVFNYTITDENGDSSSTTLTIDVADNNLLPNAVADTNTATEAGVEVSDNVLNGDDLGDEPTTVTSANQGENVITLGTAFTTEGGGSLTLNSDGSYSYTPPAQGEVPPEGLVEVFNYTITDENGDSSSTTLTIDVADNNTPPTVDLNGNDAGADYSTVFSQGSPGVTIADPNTIVTDDSGNITNATITLTNFQIGDVLDTSGLPTGTDISVDSSSTATNILLTGTGTVAEYQAAIATITFSNSETLPNRSNRTIDVVVNDGTSPSNTATTTIQWDSDGDGVADTVDLDDDNDGVPDTDELPSGLNPDADTDGDGTPDYLDPDAANFTDANNDGVDDRYDTDSDGVIDSLDIDSDNDGIVDVIEAGGEDVNGDGIIDNFTDTDGDGLDDTTATTPLDNPDTDNDGIKDVDDIDADNDGIPDNVEAQTTTGYTAPLGTDTDGDGLDDAYDPDNGGSAINPVDTESDDTPDYIDLDSDGDSIPDIQENGMADVISGTDTDGDGLDDAFEGSNTNDGFDVNDEINNPAVDLPDTQNPGGDVDYRDLSLQPGSISGAVTSSDDGSGIPGVTISLLNLDNTPVTNGNGEPIVATTQPDGSYQFTNVAPGNYKIQETNLPNYLDDSDSDGDNPNIVNVTISNGTNAIASFVDTPRSNISGTVTSNNNSPLSGVEVGLFASNGTTPITDANNQPLTAITGNNGIYTFTNIQPGDYTVIQTNLPGYGDVSDSDGNANGDSTIAVSFAAGEFADGNDFVDAPLSGSIAGTVFSDLDDSGIEGVTVGLFESNGTTPITDGGGNPITALTGANGNYTFTDVTPGNYTVVQTNLPGYSDVSDSDGNANGDNTIAVSFAPGESSEGNDFTDIPDPQNISGSVTANGVGISGVSLRLLDSNGLAVNNNNGRPVTATTGGDGSYNFTNIPIGEYTIVQTNLPGYKNISDSDGGNDNRINVTLTPNNPATGNNFVDAATIRGRVWDDSDNNGLEGFFEKGLAGVSVTLIGAGANGTFGDSDDPEDVTVTTNSNGRYEFDTFNFDEQYQIAFDLPANLESEFTGFTTQDIANNSKDRIDSDVDTGNLDGDGIATTSVTNPFTVPTGQAKGDIDAGLISEADQIDISGTASPDVLNGTSADEIIAGFKGQDTLTGGGGSDTFFMNETSEGVDIITDFNLSDDKIDFTQILNREVGYSGTDPIADGYVVPTPIGSRGTMIKVNFDLDDGINPKSVVFLAGVTNANDFDVDNLIFDSL